MYETKKSTTNPPPQSLVQFINSIVEVPESEWSYFLKILKVSHLKKGDFLFKTGDKSHILGFVTKGLLYTFFLSEDGKQHVKGFVWENRLISPIASILQNIGANFSAEALEETTVYYFEAVHLQDLQNRHHCWENLTRKCIEFTFIEREKRERETLTVSLPDRIHSFWSDFEPIRHRIPQYLMASYLGITPVGLSRILSKMRLPGP